MMTATKPSTKTAAPTRNTTLIDAAKPSRNGRASRASITVRNDESSSTPVPAGVSPLPPRAVITARFAGSASTAGSESAAWNSGVPAAARNAFAMFCCTLLNSIDRKTAVPSVPPSCRKNVADEVATPMSLAGTVFCTASISGCMLPPRPSPNDQHDRCRHARTGCRRSTGEQQQQRRRSAARSR